MNDENWLSLLMFLTDINTHSNKMNLKLQNKCEIVLDLLRYWKAFIMKLKIFADDINIKAVKYFQNVITHSNQLKINIYGHQEYIEALKAEFYK